jgi:hypothetical protein
MTLPAGPNPAGRRSQPSPPDPAGRVAPHAPARRLSSASDHARANARSPAIRPGGARSPSARAAATKTRLPIHGPLMLAPMGQKPGGRGSEASRKQPTNSNRYKSHNGGSCWPGKKLPIFLGRASRPSIGAPLLGNGERSHGSNPTSPSIGRVMESDFRVQSLFE